MKNTNSLRHFSQLFSFFCITPVIPVCSFPLPSNSFIFICLTFLFHGFYFPCCVSYLLCLLCLALCAKTSGYEIVGWVSETLLSV